MTDTVITSSLLIGVTLLSRRIFRGKVRHAVIYGMWLLVALRLLIPVHLFRLDLSILTATQPLADKVTQLADRPISGPSQEDIYNGILTDYIENDPSAFLPQVQEQIKAESGSSAATPEEILDKLQQSHPDQPILTPQAQEQAQQQAETAALPSIGQIAAVVWAAGSLIMTVWFCFINLHHQCKLRRCRQPAPDIVSPVPVFICSEIPSSCLVGLFRPKVYLTPESTEDPQRLQHVLTHELTHLRHLDPAWALVRCICLCVYWFDPLVWLAAYLSRQDCELACDEGSLRRLGDEERIAYGKTLLATASHSASAGQLLETATAMSETKAQLKERIAWITKKPKQLVLSAVCLALIGTVSVGCTFSAPILPVPDNDPPAPSDPQQEQTVTILHLIQTEHYHSNSVAFGRTEYNYDTHGRITGKTFRGAGEDFSDEYYTYTYDSYGNLIREEYRSPQQNVAYTLDYSYTYNADGTVASYTNAQEGREYFILYDKNGRFCRITYFDSQGQEQNAVLCSYNSHGRPTELTDLRGDAALQYLFEYDEEGRLIDLRFITDGETLTLQGHWTWQYPSQNVVKLQSPAHSCTFYYSQNKLIAAENANFILDKDGNIAEALDVGGVGDREVYTYQTMAVSAQDAAKLPVDNEFSRYCPIVAYLDRILGFVLPRPLQ